MLDMLANGSEKKGHCSIRLTREWQESRMGRSHQGAKISDINSSSYIFEHEFILSFDHLYRLGTYVHLSHPFFLYWNFATNRCKRYLDQRSSDHTATHRPSPTFSPKAEVKPKPSICGETLDDGYPTLGGDTTSKPTTSPDHSIPIPTLTWAQRLK